MRKLFLLLHTVRYLKAIQLFYQVWYRLKKKFPWLAVQRSLNYPATEKIQPLGYESLIVLKTAWTDKNEFNFINLAHRFSAEIDWNYAEHGKLWTYNLNYFDFLHQANLNREEGLRLIENYLANYARLKDGLEPYPTSLRIINWVKFLTIHQIKQKDIDLTLSKDVERLRHHLEYHILGNHLLENAFALFFAAFYFRHSKLYQEASTLLKAELTEQILADGGHFEQSVMYHQLMLFRVLDCLQLLHKNKWITDDLEAFLIAKAQVMMAWLEAVSFKNGDIPLVNDAAFKINPTTQEIRHYYENLGLKAIAGRLADSGYRMIGKAGYELFVDVGNITAAYQPAHFHADTFNFILYVRQIPFLVEAGTSTYNIGTTRDYERSTAAHNTVSIDRKNSSEVWSGFRVGKRAKVVDLKESDHQLEATHHAYGTAVKRQWNVSETALRITDSVADAKRMAIAYFHFHPAVQLSYDLEESRVTTNFATLYFEGATTIVKEKYTYAEEFNQSSEAIVLEVKFYGALQTAITFP